MMRRNFVAVCLFLAISLTGLSQGWGFRHLKEGLIYLGFSLLDKKKLTGPCFN